MRDVEMMMLDFVREHTSPASCPLAGNSVYCDKMFLIKCMPEFTSHLHYRIVDVSSIKELCRFVDNSILYLDLEAYNLCKAFYVIMIALNQSFDI